MPPFAPSWPATSSRPGDRRHCLQVFKSWPVVSGPGGTLQASSHLPVPICSLCFGGFQRRRLSGSCGFRPRGQGGKRARLGFRVFGCSRASDQEGFARAYCRLYQQLSQSQAFQILHQPGPSQRPDALWDASLGGGIAELQVGANGGSK